MSEKRIDIPITGMRCAACANRIEKGRFRMDGVKEVAVNFATEKAAVTVESDAADLPAIRAKIQSLGYEVTERDLHLQLTGMTCAACSARIEKVLSRMSGVYNVNVNLALETGRVSWDRSNYHRCTA
ncbi:copper ion binding protein [Sporosarcina jeotgali]|uniref:Copper ion binding protein n=1 Tax=Sporosarcina jeotgali TaxID=3020056 RepID=A0ABZ0KVF8_9BACL|nr:copper ion binding protein [Sporosarcina sp. B2O-1]WOV83960.1 copper ion binding protein [Sporosarcina sp. B2O-1]